MSKKSWNRDPLTGLSAEVDIKGDVRKQFPDCNLFAQNSIAAAAGFKSVYYFRRLVDDNPELIHAHRIKDVRGVTVGLASATNSAQAGGDNLRAKAAASHRRNLKQFRTDPSSGS